MVPPAQHVCTYVSIKLFCVVCSRIYRISGCFLKLKDYHYNYSCTWLSKNLIYPTVHCESQSLLYVLFTLIYPTPGLSITFYEEQMWSDKPGPTYSANGIANDIMQPLRGNLPTPYPRVIRARNSVKENLVVFLSEE